MNVLNSTISIIGMPGVGKTTLASDLAALFKLQVVDLDQTIELDLDRSIADFWQSEGERMFRSVERFHLLKILSHKPVILSCGGGTPCFFDNLHMINDYSFSIYLKSDQPILTDKIKTGNHPVFSKNQNPEVEWNNLLLKRRQWYEKAHFIQNAYNFEPNLLDAVSKVCLDNKIIEKLPA